MVRTCALVLSLISNHCFSWVDAGAEVAEVVLQVGDVVLDEEAEGDGIAGDGGLVGEGLVGDVADGPDDVLVECEPECEDLGPLAFAVVLKLNPGVLCVAGEVLGGDLHADDAGEVVGGGVGEVADDFLGGPLAFALGDAGVGVGEGDEPGDGGAECGGEALGQFDGV